MVIFQASEERFVELAPTNPPESLQVAVQDLAQAMHIGLHLVENDIFSSFKGSFIFF